MNQELTLPVLISRGVIVYPGFHETIEIGRDQSKEVIETALKKYDSKVLLLSQKKMIEEEPKLDEVYLYGTIATVEITKRWKDGTLTVSLTGISRAKTDVVRLDETNLPMAKVDILETDHTEANLEQAVELIKALKTELRDVPESVDQFLAAPTLGQLGATVDILTLELPQLTLDQKVQLLATLDPVARLEILVGGYIRGDKQKQDREVETEISRKIKDRMDQQQREYYLREKMRTIKEELGEGEGSDSDAIQKYRERLEKEPFPKNVKEKILASINKLDSMQGASAEANVERNYIDWMMSIPWWETTEDLKDLVHAKEVLDVHHYGLKKVKDRIVEYLAVMQKTNSLKAQIITLVGPPGVGKTSLARSIAEAVGRNFVKVSLGGVKDEAEIRGHRKTYVGAMPGRIIQTMKRAKVKNPLFLLDEIDKMSSDQRADPASAMLEVLDPEQNSEFSDHYIEEAYDLSDVMFIATANYLENIPEALYDRMEIINLSSYTEIEKMSIAKEYLVPKVLKEHALTAEELNFSDAAIDELIKYYTREAGVRQLERLLSSVARKFIVKLLNKEIDHLAVTPEIVNEYLGKRIFEHTDKQEKSQVGVVTGLAYTQFGGDILPIEVNYFPGKGNLILTGKLGDVMKESASIAYDYVRSNYNKFGIKRETFETNDIHIHVPEGAVPKDGPSAGVTITTAIVSALSGRPVSKDIGMTGEITLRGLVLPIGGLREKSISAARSGLKTILIPKKNLKDLDDVPEEVKKILEIKGIERFDQTFEEVFGLKVNENN
ncbi:ATP-dependent Lon protease [Entomoplasma freundtii]|uniref:Lon protease n=1 Tax=Entomoplasma freundtii TaxID=74700 RepID=A0A2K8NUT9_9MOLU|nr:endopeptidase La [Entomoplasma freundtii]ATZ16393.1 class III heat-shock ATP-dependent LonA protease [Entomoplasma freundtii]TDY56568.1 ATP-dependent Lon protease [Entomoplasma freundtii]